MRAGSGRTSLRCTGLVLSLLVVLTGACTGKVGSDGSGEPGETGAATATQDGTATTDEAGRSLPKPQHRLTADQTHNRFSAAIPPVLRVASGAVVEVATEEASDGQLTPDSTLEDLEGLDFDPIHPLTGPIHVEGAEPGDVLRVELLDVELGDWGWSAVVPGFGFLAAELTEPYLKTFRFEPGATEVEFAPGIVVPLAPFPGVLGVAPATEERLSTIPPRANGGNMDDPNLTEGAVVYLPVFVEGALFSIGDAHAAQGQGEVSGTAIEAPMTFLLRLEVVKGRSIPEPQYETTDHYVVTAFAETLDEAARKATRYMLDHLQEVHGMDRTEAYVLCSLAGDLQIAEVVDVPHVLVTMRIPKAVVGF